MQQLLDLRPVDLAARAIHRIEDGRGLSITCLQGTVWLTQSDDLRDIILTPGESFVLDREGTALVFAFRESAILVGPAGRVTPAGDYTYPKALAA